MARVPPGEEPVSCAPRLVKTIQERSPAGNRIARPKKLMARCPDRSYFNGEVQAVNHVERKKMTTGVVAIPRTGVGAAAAEVLLFQASMECTITRVYLHFKSPALLPRMATVYNGRRLAPNFLHHLSESSEIQPFDSDHRVGSRTCALPVRLLNLLKLVEGFRSGTILSPLSTPTNRP